MRIDANGNLVQPLNVERGPGQAKSVGRNVRFTSLSDVAPPVPAAAGGQPGNSLRQQLLAGMQFKPRSALGVLALIQIVVFFVSCWLVTPRAFITPDSLALFKVGSSNGNMERCSALVGGKFLLELRRPVTAIFLHSNLPHIFMNLLFQVLVGPKSLQMFGTGPFLTLFFISGICGNLLSDAFGHSGVGASTACYGITGAFVTQLCLMWHSLDEHARWLAKVALLTQGVYLIVWELIQWKTVDHFGHLGGLLSGLALGCIVDASAPRWKRFMCGAVLFLAALACAIQIFVVGSPEITANACEQMWAWYSK